MSRQQGPDESRRPSHLSWPEWWAERLGLGASWREALYHPVPRRSSVFDLLGFMTALAFLNQVVTGIILMTFYSPSVAGAYQSILAIDAVPAEHFVRDLHYWGANAMVVLVGLHLLRVFYVGAYKRPREFQWVSGALLLAVTIGFAFTGYLLPWDQQAYWATTVGTAMASYFPGIGSFLQGLARGGDTVSGATLGRFFTVHVLVLPLLLLALLGLHLLLVFVHGQSKVEEALPEGYRAKHRTGDHSDFPAGDFQPFWPNTVATMLGSALVLVAVLVALAATHPAPLLQQADPLNRANYQPTPAWYFLWIYQLLKLFPGRLDILGIVGLPLLSGFFLIALPFIDRNPSTQRRKRPFALAAGAAAMVFVLGFSYVGSSSAVGPTAAATTASSQAIAHPSFAHNVEPLLTASCQQCHSASSHSGGLVVVSYADLMKGGGLGPVIRAGDPADSLIIQALNGTSQQVTQMPLGGQQLPQSDIQLLSNWIAEGAPDN